MNARERLKRKLAGKKPIAKPTNKSGKRDACVKCGHPTQCRHEILEVFACQDCTKEHEDLEIISESAAMKEFFATEKDLQHLRNAEKKDAKGQPKKIYLRVDVDQFMIKKYGSKEAFAAVLAQKKLNSTDKEAIETRHKQVISFSSHRAKTYGCFSNLSMHSFTLNDKEWPSVQHYFEAQKYAGKPLEEVIRKTADAAKAKKMGNDPDHPIRDDWDVVQDDIMYAAILAKFKQNKDIQKILLDTETVPIVEHSSTDSYWGDGGDGSGKNQLGKTLMVVRGKLRREQEARRMQRKRKEKSSDEEKEDNENEKEHHKKDKGKEKKKEKESSPKKAKVEPPVPKKPLETWDFSKVL